MTPERLQQALLDPASVFAGPEDVLATGGLSDRQKVEILMRWEYDAAEESVAVEEGMPGRDNDLLQRVLAALHKLTGRLDVEHAGPTKQHPLSGSRGTKKRRP